MRDFHFSIVFILMYSFVHTQEIDSYQSAPNQKRKVIVSSVIGLGWVGSMTSLYNIWYRKMDQSPFHKFNDGNLWLQMDKAGHLYTGYQISTLTNGMLEWAGFNNKQAAITAGSIGLSYLCLLEIFDGFSSSWGFSWNDMSANLIGSSLFTVQELKWNEQRFLPKFSYHPTTFAQVRPEVLGSTFGQRLLKDYNGQTYWISFNPFQSLKNNPIPKWVCLSFGYSVHEKIKGDLEVFTDQKGINYHAQREWLISMDIDFSKIPAKKPGVKKILKQLNYLKLPFPTVMIRNGTFHGLPVYF
jgi:hypothetical protein